MIKLVYLYILSLPFFGFSLLNVDGRGVGRFDWVVGGLLLIIFGIRYVNKNATINHNPVNKYMLIYIYTGLLSIVNLWNAADAQMVDFATKLIQLLMVTPIFFVISSLSIDIHQLIGLIRVWVFCGFAISAHAIYQILGQALNLPFIEFVMTNPSVSTGTVSARTLFGYTQPTSVFQEPSYLGAFLGPCLIFAIVLGMSTQSKSFFFRQVWLNRLMIIIIFLGILLSNSQAILFSLMATLFTLFFVNSINRRKLFVWILISIIIFFIVSLLLQFLDIHILTAFSFRTRYLLLNILDPYNTGQVTSYLDRLISIQAGLNVWLERPLLGVGLGNMAYYSDRQVTNNPWLQLLVEQGIVGIVALMTVFWVISNSLIQKRKFSAASAISSLLFTATFAVLLLTMINGFFTFNWTHPIRIFTLAMANLICIKAS